MTMSLMRREMAYQIRSANRFSVRRKKSAPVTNQVIEIADETRSKLSGRVFDPSIAHLNPSTTPTMGFSAYNVCQGSWSRLLGYAIGVANIHICTRNGTVWR